MKIKTVEDLYDRIDKDLGWRRKELVFFKRNIESAKDAASLRAGVVMLYAHWEGFVKNTAEYYLTFIARRRLKYEQLRSCFVAFALKKEFEALQMSDNAATQTQIVQFIRNNLSQRANLPYDYAISTKSNLNSKRLKEILTSIGIDFTGYEAKKCLIDEKLIAKRNTIAHGQGIPLDYNETIFLYQSIMDAIVQIKNDIQNAAVMEAYKRRIETREGEKEALS